MEISELTLLELSGLLNSRQVTSVELLNYYLGRVEEFDGDVRAFLETDAEGARSAAQEWDDKRARGEDVPPFAGIPMAVKNNMMDTRMVTDAGSQILSGFVSPYEATVLQKLREAGFVLFGKLNLDEFAMGSSTENSSHFTTHNPWNLDYSPGGSSGGSTAAVAARMTPVSLGSDTGGSIRQPASFCGVTGFKPSYGRVSRYGIVSFASSLDQVGPIAPSAKDAAIIMNIIGHNDSRDATSYLPKTPADYMATLEDSVKGLRIGIPQEIIDHLDRDVLDAFRNAVIHLESLGCVIDEVTLPRLELCIPTYYIIAPAEAAANLARYDGIKYGKRLGGSGDADTATGGSGGSANPLDDLYLRTRTESIGEEVQRRIMLGNLALSSKEVSGDYYLKAQKVRQLVREDFEEAFTKFDLIVAPTSPTPPFKLGEKTEDAVSMYYSDLLTLPSSLYGGAAISIPAGFDSNGLPIGLQIMGAVFDDARVLQLAHAFQTITEYHNCIPKDFS